MYLVVSKEYADSNMHFNKSFRRLYGGGLLYLVVVNLKKVELLEREVAGMRK